MISVHLSSVHFGHLGNGITVWTTEIEENNDFKKLAHIDHDRSIHWYEECTEIIKRHVMRFATTANPSVSITQRDQFVFKFKAKDGNTNQKY